ncbi:uncharacterized protein [Epargyreus clarus]|uniref:uncharacterized protein n=1 Tax=Epargyreus clarus TaxID=520877 RepID=UPI003C2C1865
MEDLQKNPLKLYIQDIFRAKRSDENKYVYEMFGLKFKNIMIHGIITAIYNTNSRTTNIELSDPTGTVQIYYDSTKNNSNITDDNMKHLVREFAKACRSGYDNTTTMSSMLDAIEKKKQNKMNFEPGSHLSVIGDIFIDDLKNKRMVSAYICKPTSVEYDVVWLEELSYLYEKFYLWIKQ